MDVNKLQRIKNEITKLDKIHHLKISQKKERQDLIREKKNLLIVLMKKGLWKWMKNQKMI